MIGIAVKSNENLICLIIRTSEPHCRNKEFIKNYSLNRRCVIKFWQEKIFIMELEDTFTHNYIQK